MDSHVGAREVNPAVFKPAVSSLPSCGRVRDEKCFLKHVALYHFMSEY